MIWLLIPFALFVIWYLFFRTDPIVSAVIDVMEHDPEGWRECGGIESFIHESSNVSVSNVTCSHDTWSSFKIVCKSERRTWHPFSVWRLRRAITRLQLWEIKNATKIDEIKAEAQKAAEVQTKEA